jgi:membrane protease YdiL (CAAX protease family)
MSEQNTENVIENNGKGKTLAVLIALIAAAVGLTFLTKLVFQIENYSIRVAVICLIYLAFIGLVIGACLIEKKPVAGLGFQKDNVFKQIIIGLSIAAALALIIGVFPILIGSNLAGNKPSSASGAVVSIVLDIVFIGTFEELIFRGFIQTRLKELIKYKWACVLIAAALFGLWHIINGAWFQVLFTFAIGCVFGFCREYLKNCSLLSVIIAHGVYDALLVVVTLSML